MSSTAASSLTGARPLASRQSRKVTRCGALVTKESVTIEKKGGVTGRAPLRRRVGETITASSTSRRAVILAAYDSTRSLAVRATHSFYTPPTHTVNYNYVRLLRVSSRYFVAAWKPSRTCTAHLPSFSSTRQTYILSQSRLHYKLRENRRHYF